MHQAVLAGSVLYALKPEEVHPLPMEINYPLHLHARVPLARRPGNINMLTTCRYEDYGESFGDPEVNGMIQIDEDLQDWLGTQFNPV